MRAGSPLWRVARTPPAQFASRPHCDRPNEVDARGALGVAADRLCGEPVGGGLAGSRMTQARQSPPPLLAARPITESRLASASWPASAGTPPGPTTSLGATSVRCPACPPSPAAAPQTFPEGGAHQPDEFPRVLSSTKRRLDWATLHQRTFGTDVLRCPCGGRRTIRALHSTRKAAEERLTALAIALPSRALPPATAPPQLAFAV